MLSSRDWRALSGIKSAHYVRCPMGSRHWWRAKKEQRERRRGCRDYRPWRKSSLFLMERVRVLLQRVGAWLPIHDTEAIRSGERSAAKKRRSEGKGMKMAGLRSATMATTLLSADLISLELSRAFLNGFASLFVLYIDILRVYVYSARNQSQKSNIISECRPYTVHCTSNCRFCIKTYPSLKIYFTDLVRLKIIYLWW